MTHVNVKPGEKVYIRGIDGRVWEASMSGGSATVDTQDPRDEIWVAPDRLPYARDPRAPNHPLRQTEDPALRWRPYFCTKKLSGCFCNVEDAETIEPDGKETSHE